MFLNLLVFLGIPFVVVVVQLPSLGRLFVTLGTEACQVSLSLTISQSLPKFMSIASVMPSNHFIDHRPKFNTIKLIEEHIGTNFHTLGLNKDLLIMTSEAKFIKSSLTCTSPELITLLCYGHHK